jgi:DNA polymerase-1
MERHGIKVDREALAGLSAEFRDAIGALEGEIHALAGQPFTIGSPKQLGEMLFDKLGYKGGKKGKTGQYSTDQSVLERLAARARRSPRKVLDWRQLSKLRSTYTDALQAAINPDGPRPHQLQPGRRADRAAVLDRPQPAEHPDPHRDRPPDPRCLCRRTRQRAAAADYSQIELRLAAHMADVPALKEAFAAGEDIHARTAQEMFGEVNRDTRGRAKTINFAILYGISRWGLAGRLGISSRRGAGDDRPLFRALPRHPALYPRDAGERARARLFRNAVRPQDAGSRASASKPIQAERQGSERAAINAPIQGTSADIIKRAMVRMMPALEDAGLGHVDAAAGPRRTGVRTARRRCRGCQRR